VSPSRIRSPVHRGQPLSFHFFISLTTLRGMPDLRLLKDAKLLLETDGLQALDRIFLGWVIHGDVRMGFEQWIDHSLDFDARL